MVEETVSVGLENTRKYFINFQEAEQGMRSLSAIIAARKCYLCQQGDTQESIFGSGPEDHINQIVDMCSKEPDYLLPDTPLKEAVFRVMISEGNREMTASEISGILSNVWRTSTYPRDLSPRVVMRTLENSHSYCISAILEPDNEVSARSAN